MRNLKKWFPAFWLAVVAAMMQPHQGSAEFKYTPLKEPDMRVKEGGQLSQWLQGDIRDPFSEVLVIFPAGEDIFLCEPLLFKRNEQNSMRGHWEILEAAAGRRELTFDLKALVESDAEFTYTDPSGRKDTIEFQEPVWKTYPQGGFYEAEAERICSLSIHNQRHCESTSYSGVAPLYVVGVKENSTASRDLICAYFSFLPHPDRKK